MIFKYPFQKKIFLKRYLKIYIHKVPFHIFQWKNSALQSYQQAGSQIHMEKRTAMLSKLITLKKGIVMGFDLLIGRT